MTFPPKPTPGLSGAPVRGRLDDIPTEANTGLEWGTQARALR
jgi:hypothetical protein